MTDNLDTFRTELRALAQRVAALEHPRNESNSAETPSRDNDAFWALTGLDARLDRHPSTRQGEVMVVGSLTLPTGAPVSWQFSRGSEELIEADWSERASAFAALGHPVRLELLRHILSGMHATSELAELESLGTTGQLHHHLKPLIAAGWIRQSGRGNYEVPVARIVPLLACLIGVE